MCYWRESQQHNDVIKWKHFPRYWPFVRGIHRPTVNSPHTGQCSKALMLSLICAWINGWVHNREAGDLRRGQNSRSCVSERWIKVIIIPNQIYDTMLAMSNTGVLKMIYPSNKEALEVIWLPQSVYTIQSPFYRVIKQPSMLWICCVLHEIFNYTFVVCSFPRESSCSKHADCMLHDYRVLLFSTKKCDTTYKKVSQQPLKWEYRKKHSWCVNSLSTHWRPFILKNTSRNWFNADVFFKAFVGVLNVSTFKGRVNLLI